MIALALVRGAYYNHANKCSSSRHNCGELMRIEVRVTPRAGRNAVGGVDAEGRLRVRVSAPPSDGEANAAVIQVLTEALGVGSRSLRLVSGATSRVKVFEIAGEPETLAERLATLLAKTPSEHGNGRVQ